jgi:AraC-like DNA-binding protein/mannose-6-phosphate isomerase-like protein (cupin superfamily)
MNHLSSQSLSPKRQNNGLWATLAKGHEVGTSLPMHQHQTGQLIFATSGVMLVETVATRWTVPPQRALWVPPHHPHAIYFVSKTELRTVYCQSTLMAQVTAFKRQNEVHAIMVSNLMRELILGLFDDQFDRTTEHAMVCLMLQTLQHTTSLETHLPMPTSEVLRQLMMQILQTHNWQLSMNEIANMAAMSERTFSRHFSAEVGLSFRAWRQRARVIASLDLLTSNHSVKAIARTLQFESAAAYIAAFRKILRCTPNSFRLKG